MGGSLSTVRAMPTLAPTRISAWSRLASVTSQVIIAARAVTQPDLPLSALAEELEEQRLDALDDLSADLRTVFACSLRVLSPEAVELFGLIGLTSAPELSLKAVTALTGLWFFPGMFILVGPFIWFVQTNNALNEYWRSQGVTRTSLV